MYTWGDNYIILLRTTAMLEVYLLQQCNVVNMRVLANCWVWNYKPVAKTRSANKIGIRIFRFLHSRSGFVHTKYTSNMVACYDNDVNDVTAPHVQSIGPILWKTLR